MAARRDANGRFIKGSGSGSKSSATARSNGGLERRLADMQHTLNGMAITAGMQGQGGAPGEEDDATLVRIARAHEYGIGVPERPFMRTAAKRHGKKWVEGAEQSVKEAAGGNAEQAQQTIRLLGTVMVGDIQQTIEDGPWLSNSDETIRRKGSSRPLIDDAQMIQSVRAVVVSADGKQDLIG